MKKYLFSAHKKITTTIPEGPRSCCCLKCLLVLFLHLKCRVKIGCNFIQKNDSLLLTNFLNFDCPLQLLFGIFTFSGLFSKYKNALLITKKNKNKNPKANRGGDEDHHYEDLYTLFTFLPHVLKNHPAGVAWWGSTQTSTLYL